ncbi:hypothetical protein OS493_038330 [Desmophyllum pertusum]|uniref:SWIM-type domain-containing protein n=1 Tax=Desmophyllum pertusum TaxID=174260 RepID=A0A9W9YHP5_9CNID|nr:hypothetical protein OS493_038330 [Desmophyllum pertusum]
MDDTDSSDDECEITGVTYGTYLTPGENKGTKRTGEIEMLQQDEESSLICNRLERKGGGGSVESLFHEGNAKMPLYERTARSFGITDVVKAVLRSQNEPGILCEQHPMRVTYNGVFLIDLKCVHLKDLVADGNGIFINTGQPTHTINICRNEDERDETSPQIKVLARAKRPLKSRSEFHVQRYYYRHSKKTSFCRRIYLLKNREDEIHGNVAVLQYLWEGEEGEIKLAPHGNATKSSIPFTATKFSVIQKLHSNLARHQVKEAIDLTEGELGSSIYDAKSPSEHVRSTHQGHYTARKMRARAGTGDKHKKEWDELYSLMTAAKEDNRDFIRSIVNHPEPMCLLATDFQLHSLSQSCADAVDFRPVSIDPTFNNGPFNVTPVSFRNIVLESNRTGQCPVFLGPLLIHQSKTFQAYHYLTSQLVGLQPRLQSMQAFGTDGEDELIKACKSVFKESIALRCFRHFQQNVETALKNYGMQNHKNAIIGHIFGNEETPGLLEAESEEEFDQALQVHISTWKELPGGERFCKYLSDRSTMMKESMTADIRAKAGLGNPPEKFYTNDSESNNERIKHKMEHREAGLCSFVAGMKQLAYSQETEFAKALCGMSSEFKVRDVFSSFVVPASKWYDMREDQRRSYVLRIYKLAISEMYAEDPQQCVLSSRSDVQLPSISTTPEHSGLGSIIPLPVLKGIWRKAALLLSVFENNVSSAPTNDPNTKMFCVQGQTDMSPVPYFVQMHCCSKCRTSCSHVKVTCNCKMYKPNSICSHALVVAEKCGDLNSFLKWRASQAKSYNFTSLATVNINTKSSGKKGNRPRRDRSQKKNQCVDARDTLGVENMQHARGQSSASGSSLPYQVRTGSTATIVPIISDDDGRDTLGVVSGNMQHARMQSFVSGSSLPSQVRTGSTANNVPIASVPTADSRAAQRLGTHDYLQSTFSRNVWTENQPHYPNPGSLMVQTAQPQSTAGTMNTHTPNMAIIADNMYGFQQHTMQAPTQVRLPDSFAMLSTMMLDNHPHGLLTSEVPVQSSNTGYFPQTMPQNLAPTQGYIYPGVSPNRSPPQAGRQPWYNNNPFTVMKIKRRISRCTGCRGTLPKTPDNNPCPSPLDLVVQHVEKDEYPFKDQLTGAVQKRISQEKPKYYHPRPSCILQRHPYFNTSMLLLQEGLNIDSVHENYLASVFSVSI